MAKAACNAGNILYTTLTIELSKDVVCTGGTVTATVTTVPSGATVTVTSVSSKISITPTVGLPTPAVFTITGVTNSDLPGDVPLVATIISGVETDPEVVSCIETSSITVIKVESVGVHSSDTNSYKIASNLGTHSNHFVCVKDTGDIVLDAVITPTNAADAITWEADGATITSPAVGIDKTTAKLPSATSQKIPVRIKVGSCTCWSGTVWVAWSSLAGDTNGVSTLNAQSLGLAHGRAADRYNVAGGIEWIATITPSALITDTDRPAVETQTRVAPPGTDSGVPGPGNNDATGRGFAGWDFSRQIRQQFEKGNPLKPGEPMTATTSSDPIPLHRPQSLPVSLVEGNDDKAVGDEDDDPYDGPSSGAGQKGTLRADDRPADYLIDDRDYNDVVPGEDGDSIRGRIQFREFIRVQLGTTWYRVSPANDGLWRLHFDLQRTNGVYQLWPGTTPQFEMDNANYSIP